jgi:hypothetical protein
VPLWLGCTWVGEGRFAPQADVVEGLVVEREALVGVLDQLVARTHTSTHTRVGQSTVDRWTVCLLRPYLVHGEGGVVGLPVEATHREGEGWSLSVCLRACVD